MVAAELAGLWLTIAALAASFILAAVAVALDRPGWLAQARAVALAGLVPQAVALAVRGIAQYAPPFTTYFESVMFGTFLALAGWGWSTRGRGGFPAAIAVVAPVNLLLLGSAVFTAREFKPLGPALQSWWLVVHVLFALLAFAAMTGAAGAAVLGVTNGRAAWRPEPAALDRFLSRAFALSFLFQLVMTTSGAVWAHEAWGRYWGWDPIETFSLLTLIVFGIALHLVRMHGWRGRTLAWAAIAGFLLTVYGIWGVPLFFPSVHLYQGPRGPGGGM